MGRYPRPFDTLYLACFTDDPSQVHANNVYTAASTDWQIAIFYDMHHEPNVTGTNQTVYQYTQRIAPKRHGNGANGLFLDGHARGSPTAEIKNMHNTAQERPPKRESHERALSNITTILPTFTRHLKNRFPT
jgi:prepilin-type processing-associated H-X9-DG protein